MVTKIRPSSRLGPATHRFFRAVWATFKPARRRDIRRLLPDFETRTLATQERWKRIELLNTGNREDKALADLMADHADDRPANITCCPLTTRGFRIWWIAQMLRLAGKFGIVWLVTFIYPEESVPFGKLAEVDWSTIERRTRSRFERLIPLPIWAMGGHEVHAD